MSYKSVMQVGSLDWAVRRYGSIDEIVDAHDHVKWRVTVRDEGRDPFLTRFFSTPDAAVGFLARVHETAEPTPGVAA